MRYALHPVWLADRQMHRAAPGIYCCAIIIDAPHCTLLSATLHCSCHQLLWLSHTLLTQGLLIHSQHATISATFASYTPASLEYRTPLRAMVGVLIAHSMLPTAVCLLPKPLVRCERFEPPMQGLRTAHCIQYGLPTGRCTMQRLVFILVPPLVARHIAS